MTNQLTRRALILVLNLMIQTGFSNIAHSADALLELKPGAADSADANTTDRYTLPPSKVYIEPCQREVLRLHPGMIEKQRLLHRHGDFFIRYEIQAPDGQSWFMLCDLATRKIIDAF
ncbi:MAG: hypothetical protein ACXV9R_13550 [Methylobacter sp.]